MLATRLVAWKEASEKISREMLPLLKKSIEELKRKTILWNEPKIVRMLLQRFGQNNWKMNFKTCAKLVHMLESTHQKPRINLYSKKMKNKTGTSQVGAIS